MTHRLRSGVGLDELGARLRERRVGLGLSLDELATRSGVSRSMLSDVERNRKVPSIVVLDLVAAALQTRLVDLLNPARPATVIVQRADEQIVARDSAGWERRLLSPSLPGSTFELMRTTIGPGVDAGDWPPHGEGSGEYLHVLGGTLELRIEGTTYVVHAGDSVYHDGNVSHGYRNPSRNVCDYLLALDRSAAVGPSEGHR